MMFTALLVALWCIGLIWSASRAGATTEPVVTNSRGVVLSSTLPPCGSPPCSYNFGEWGNHTALAWWYDRNAVKHYVWGHVPSTVSSGWAHWSTRTDRRDLGIGRDCWVHRGRWAARYKCARAGQPM